MSKDSLLQLSRRRLSPALFALVVLAFLLPFGTVACDDAQTTFTGLELATWRVPAGGHVERNNFDCSADLGECVEDRGSLAAAVAVLAATLGLGLGMAAFRRGEGWCVAAGLVAMLDLGLETVSTDADVTLQPGFVFAVLLYAWLALLHIWRAFRRPRRPWNAQISSL